MPHSTPLIVVFTSLLSLLPLPTATSQIDESRFHPSNIITRDVAIIGGGASGTYAAIRLREDLSTSIALIEPKPRLGGHVDTYTVPETNTTLEFGVQSYIAYGPAPNFFKRLGVETRAYAARRLTSVNVDIVTGKPMTAYIPPSNDAVTAAFEKWLHFVAKYETLVEPGYWDFPAPGNIPAEFLAPFGEFAKTLGIEAAVPRIAAISDVGAGGMENLLTLEVVQAFGAPMTRAVLNNSLLLLPLGSNSVLYQRAYAILQNDVYLSSSIKAIERSSEHGVRIVVQSAVDGAETLIKAKAVLWTPYPSYAKNLQTFALDEKEAAVFQPWVPSWSFVGVVKIPCIPENVSVQYLAPNSAPSNYLDIRDYNFTLRLDSTGPLGLGLFRALFSANYSISNEQVKLMIAKNVQKLVAAGTFNYTGACTIEWRDFSSHEGVIWPRGREVIGTGFVQDLYALQGYRNTWWTGRSWTGYYTSNVWTFTDTVLERVLRGIKRVQVG